MVYRTLPLTKQLVAYQLQLIANIGQTIGSPSFICLEIGGVGGAQVSFTIQASGRHAPLHPSSPPMKRAGKDEWIFTEEISKYRRLSVRECALIQTFDKSDEFVGNLQSQYLQIGNAVPPLLSRQIAKAINSNLQRIKVIAVPICI